MSKNHHWPPISEEQLNSDGMDPNTEFKWACNKSGHCCFGTPVLINPYDVWNLAHNDALMKRFGYKSTHDLFGKDAPFALYLGSDSKLPVASINSVELGEDNEICPFLTPVYQISSYEEMKRVRDGLARPELHKTDDGTDRPMMICGIHEARPTICRAFPLGRFSARALPEKQIIITDAEPETLPPFRLSGKTCIVNNTHNCDSCWGLGDEEAGRKKMLAAPDLWTGTAQQWLDQTGTTTGWIQTDRWWKILDIINIPAIGNATRFAIGLLAYDFDGTWIAGGSSPQEARSKRAESFEAHMDRIGNLADVIARAHLSDDVELFAEAMILMADLGLTLTKGEREREEERQGIINHMKSIIEEAR